MRTSVVNLVCGSALVQLFTEAHLNEASLWVLFRDTFVYLMMEKTTFFDFASGVDPFEGIIDIYSTLNESPEPATQTSGRKTSETKERQVYEDELAFNEGVIQNQRPALLYIIETVAFNLMKHRRRFPEHARFDSSDLVFKVLSDLVIEIHSQKFSLEKLSDLLSFIPIQSKLFSQLTATIAQIRVGEHFFTHGHLNKAILRFLLSNIQEIFLWVSTKKFFQLMRALLDILSGPAYSDLAICNPANPNQIFDRGYFKTKIRGILKLQDFVSSIQKQLLKLDFEKLKKILFLNESVICSTFFVKSNSVLRGLEYPFDVDTFREENITIKNMNYINRQKQAHKMSIFAICGPKEDPNPLTPQTQEKDLSRLKKSSVSILDRLTAQNLRILGESSLYRRMRLVVQNNHRIYLSKPFQQLLEFLFRSLVRWVKRNPHAPKHQLEEHFHLLVGDCGDLNILVNILLEETSNFDGRVSELLSWVSQSPNDVFLRILIDKFSQVIFEVARKKETSSSLFSKQKLLQMLKMDSPSQAELSIKLIRSYEQHLISKQHSTKSPRKMSHSNLDLGGLNILTVVFHLRSELRLLVDQTSENSPEHMLQVGKFLISESTHSVQSRVRNSVLIYLLGSLQDKLGFLDNQLSRFRPLLPDSLLNSQFHCLRIYNNSILNNSTIRITKLLRRLSRGEAPSSEDMFSRQDFYSLTVNIVNQQMTLPESSTRNKDLFNQLKNRCNPIQQFFLDAVINDFPSAKLISLRQPSEDYLKPIVLFILNVTLSTLATLEHGWFLPRLIQDLTASIINRVPFNFKNVLQFDKSMNTIINKNKSSAKMYECVNCGTPFSIGDCGNPVLLEKAAKCINCKKEIGAKEYHKPNDNTREISYEEFREKSLSSPLYSVHEYLLDDTVTMDGLPRFGFRMGHLLTHALYAGLTLTGLIDCPKLLLAQAQTSHPHLNLKSENMFYYFYRHVQCDLNWLKKELRINELPTEFLGYILQDVVNSPGIISVDEELARVQADFASFVETYRMKFAQILVEVRSKRGKTVTQEVVSEDAIKRNVDFEEVEDDVDRFLFLNLRQTTDLNLLLFHSQLKKRPDPLPNLDFYLDHFELLSTGFGDIIVPIYNMNKFMKDNFNLCFPMRFGLNTTVVRFKQILGERGYSKGENPTNSRIAKRIRAVVRGIQGRLENHFQTGRKVRKHLQIPIRVRRNGDHDQSRNGRGRPVRGESFGAFHVRLRVGQLDHCPGNSH